MYLELCAASKVLEWTKRSHFTQNQTLSSLFSFLSKLCRVMIYFHSSNILIVSQKMFLFYDFFPHFDKEAEVNVCKSKISLIFHA